jgi:hypothetical protein
MIKSIWKDLNRLLANTAPFFKVLEHCGFWYSQDGDPEPMSYRHQGSFD